MDTTRARDALPTDDVPRLPNLTRIADEGVVFDDAITTAPWTLPSHASMFTGQYTSDHGTHGGTQYFDPDAPPLARRLRAAGYQTAAVSNNTWVTPEFGFDDGFDDFYVRSRPLAGGEDAAAVGPRLREAPVRTVARLLDDDALAPTVGNLLYDRLFRERGDDGARLTNWRIERWLADAWDPDRPFFMFANYIEPHLPYTPPAEYLPDEFGDEAYERVAQEPWGYLTGATEMTGVDFEVLRAMYRAEMKYLDAKIGELYDLLRERGILDETMIVVVGDHGENIGDHGFMDHQFCLYDSLLRVPLVVRHPDERSRENVSSLVELRDVYPTLLEVAGADQSESRGVSRRSLLGHVRGREGPDGHREYAIAEYYTPRPSTDTLRNRYPDASVDVSRYDRSLRCIRTDDWKYVQATDGEDELFDLSSDPRETTNVIHDNPEVERRLRRTLLSDRGAFDSLGGRRYEPDSETEERLNSLGYI